MSAQEKQLAAVNSTPARFNWTGLDPQQMKNVAQAMAMSGMFPDIAKDSAKAFVKIMAGQEMGIPPFQAMSDISIISGKAAAGGNIYASKVKSHPRYDYRVKNWTSKGCAIEFFEILDGTRQSIGTSQFDENDSRTAGLLGKGNWKTYPRNMYFNRAMTAGVRTFCPDALNGVNAYTPEELGAEVDQDGRVAMQSAASFPAADQNDEHVQTSANDSDPDIVQDAADMSDELQDGTTLYVVPTFPGEGTKIIAPAMTKQVNDWIAELGWDDVEVATFMHSVIGMPKPKLRADALKVLEALADELNERQQPQEIK